MATKTKANKVKVAKEFDKMAEDAKQETFFKFHLNMCGQIFESERLTALDALRALPKPQKITNKGKLTIFYGDKTKEILLTVPRLKRIFFPNFQKVIIKQLVYGL